jgi:hypothetical protein
VTHVTAKVKLNPKITPGHGGEGTSTLTFYPDYADERNKAWATATPALSLTMTVKDAVADHFVAGEAYTLTFAPSED